MIKKIAHFQIPLYLVFFILLLSGGSIIALAQYYLGGGYDLNLFLTQGQSTFALEYGSWPDLAKKDFFDKVRDQFIADKATFIEADLSNMKLSVFRDGQVVKKVDILTKGREGSWWETPAGLYKIESKERNHFSSFGKVYQPWSMAFQGNFFIHGWPYYPNGEPVSSSYSGGCIRLSTEDAEEIYKLVSIGTPVLVFEKDFQADEMSFQFSAPKLTAPSYLVADLQSNFVFLQKEVEAQRSIASLSKLMTALIAVEYINLEKELVVPQDALVPTSKPRLRAGEKISVYNLLPLLLLESSNEAAEVIANHLGRIRFVELMNKKAQAIGMTHTVFIDPSGRQEGDVSTAEDLFLLAKYLKNNRSFILKISAGQIDQRIYGPLKFSDLTNFNVFEKDPEFLGGKVGQSETAGETMLAVFGLRLGTSTRPVVMILLGSENYGEEGPRLINWIKGNYAPIE